MGYSDYDRRTMWTAIGFGVPIVVAIASITFGVWCSYSYQVPASDKNYELVLQRVYRLEERVRETEKYLNSLKLVIETRPQVHEEVRPGGGR